MIISIDFDGTIVENQYPEIGALMPDAKESIIALCEEGHKIIINTCREGKELLEATEFLLHHDIPFHRVNDNLPENIEKYGSNSRKIYADQYIDDRNIGGFPGWVECLRHIHAKEETICAQNPANLIVRVHHNLYVDTKKPEKGYMILTKNGLYPYSSQLYIRKCGHCKQKKVLPPAFLVCAECLLILK